MSARRPKKPPKGHPPEVRAAATAALLQGQSISSVAEEYQLPRSTVASWAGSARLHVYETLDEAAEDGNRRERIGKLLVAYLEESLQTLVAQAKVFRDPAWLKECNAQDAAILHGVMTDKTVRLLNAMTPDDALPDRVDDG